MPASNRQESRIAVLETPLDKDVLSLSRFDASEGLSELFNITIEAVSEKQSLPFDDLIGRTCSIEYTTIDNRIRHFHGHLSDAQIIGVRNDNFVYRLTLKPWLWLMSFTTNSFIFHNLTAVEIIEKVFQRHGFAKYNTGRLTQSYPKLEYTVQYCESDMDFVRRLMEKNGIGFYFEHTASEHKLVLSDGASCYDALEGGPRPFVAIGAQHRRPCEHIHTWTPGRNFTSGAVATKDYDFKKPPTNMQVDRPGNATYEHGQLEIYDYPGVYTEQALGSAYATSLLNSLRAQDKRYQAAGDLVSAHPGALLTLSEHYDSDQDGDYLILRCVHNYVAEEYRSGATDTNESPYEGFYELMPVDVPYAPPVMTSKPIISGPQTAVVVGTGEIDVDEYGRIIVQFHWDREADKSMRCRLAQVWAGKSWGGIYIPRIGMEVIVQFIDGNPDQPLVTGTVYNAKNTPPFALPGQKNIAGLKSNSTPGGGGYNEYVFDDTKGNELIRQHGQYDLDSTIEHDERWTVKNNETRKVGVNRTTTIGTNDTLDVGSTLKITAKDKVEITVGASKITMTPDKIKIESLTVEIKAMDFKTSATLSKHEAAALMDIKGTLVKINS